MYISVGKGAFLHAELQCTVHAANGQSLIKFLENIRTRVGISQERNQQFRRDVVVIGKAATVCQVVPVGVISHLFYQHADGGKPVLGRDTLLAATLHTQPAEHGFGIEIIALLHYLFHHILHGSFIGSHPHGKTVLPELAEKVRDFRFCRRNAPDASCLQPFHKGMHEEVLRRKYIDRTCTAGIDVARHGDVVPVHQPVARHTETSGRRGTALGLVRQCIIGRGGSAFKACAVAPFAGCGGNLHHSFIQHQR